MTNLVNTSLIAIRSQILEVLLLGLMMTTEKPPSIHENHKMQLKALETTSKWNLSLDNFVKLSLLLGVSPISVLNMHLLITKTVTWNRTRTPLDLPARSSSRIWTGLSTGACSSEVVIFGPRHNSSRG